MLISTLLRRAREGAKSAPVPDRFGERRLLGLVVLLLRPTVRAVLRGARSGDDGRHGSDPAAVLDRGFGPSELFDDVADLGGHVGAVLRRFVSCVFVGVGEERTEMRGLCERVMTQYLFQRRSRSLASLELLKCEISRG